MKLSPILVIGATGYIGGRLVPLLLQAGYRVRVIGRSLAKLRSRPWASHPDLQIRQADVLDAESLQTAVEGCRAAYYLVNFMHSSGIDFEKAERQGALNMVAASSGSSLERIIYCGWLQHDCAKLTSRHLRARCETAHILGSGPVPLTCFRAAVVFGSGSASFEILRYLADRQPVMLAAPWMQKPVQPISIRNVLAYLKGCLEHDETIGRSFDIGGPEVLTYEQLIRIYTETAGLPTRYIIPVGSISPHMSALWTHLVTPIPARVVWPIAEELSTGAVCREDRIRAIIPQELVGCREMIRRAISKTEQQIIEGCWSDAGPLLPPEWAYFGDEEYAGGAIMECGYRIRLAASPEEIWDRIVRIGGENGWYYGESLWKARGWLDKLFGGTSLMRGRRHPSQLFVGDALDFWRVLRISPPHRLLLLSEMKTPGEALLEFRIKSLPDGTTELEQLSRFRPRGLPGLLYWYVLYPPHLILFRGMLRTIARAVGKPVLQGPERFTTGVGGAYALRL